jgi:hypothetical protein
VFSEAAGSVEPGGKDSNRLREKWWAGKDLNPRHHAYQACALTLSYQPIRGIIADPLLKRNTQVRRPQ